MQNKNPFSSILGKMIVTKEGKRLGFVKDATPYTKNLNLEKINSSEFLVPYNSIIAIGDFVVVSEEDLI